jgi:hypothetical protein
MKLPEGVTQKSALEGLSLQCEATELPGKTLTTADIRYSGPTFKVPYHTIMNDITLTFLCASDMWEKRLFDLWMSFIQNDYTYDIRFKDEYVTDIHIIQRDANNKKKFEVKLLRAFPLSVNQIQLAWASEDVARLSVTFSYERIDNLIDKDKLSALRVMEN